MIGFGKFGKEWKLGIVSTLEDPRLVRIDSTSEGFFNNVLGYVTDSKNIQAFIEAIKEVTGVKPFWKPIYDPSLEGVNLYDQCRTNLEIS